MTSESRHSQLRHIEDGAELTFLINNEGDILVICSECKKLWAGNLTPKPWPVTAESQQADHRVKESLHANPGVIENTGIDMEYIDSILSA